MSCIIKPRLYTPLEIVAGVNDRLDFIINGITDYTANITPGFYFSPEDFFAEVKAQLDAETGYSFTVSLSATGRTVITSVSGGYGTIGFDGATPSGSRNIRRELGWLTATATATSAATLTSPRQILNLWLPDEAVAFDSYWYDRHIEGRTISIAGVNRRVKHGTQRRREVRFELCPEHKTVTVDGSTAYTNEAFDQVYDRAKCRFRWWSDIEELGTYFDCFLIEPEVSFTPTRQRPYPGLYEFALLFGEWEDDT